MLKYQLHIHSIHHHYNFDAGSISDVTGNGNETGGHAARHTDSPHN